MLNETEREKTERKKEKNREKKRKEQGRRRKRESEKKGVLGEIKSSSTGVTRGLRWSRVHPCRYVPRAQKRPSPSLPYLLPLSPLSPSILLLSCPSRVSLTLPPPSPVRKYRLSLKVNGRNRELHVRARSDEGDASAGPSVPGGRERQGGAGRWSGRVARERGAKRVEGG